MAQAGGGVRGADKELDEVEDGLGMAERLNIPESNFVQSSWATSVQQRLAINMRETNLEAVTLRSVPRGSTVEQQQQNVTSSQFDHTIC